MHLNRIRYFTAVAEELHYGRAAARLNVVQPALSQQIKLLEVELGTPLFERSSRKVALTAAGSAYLVEARRLIQQVEIAAQAARDAAGGHTGTLCVGFVGNAIWASLPRTIRTFRSVCPRVELVLSQRPRGPQLTMLDNGALDIAIVPGPILRPDVAAVELERSQLHVVLPGGHPLAGSEAVEIGSLAQERFLAVPAPNDPRRINEVIYQLCSAAGFQPILGQAVEQMHTSLSLVSAGLGVTMVPRWMSGAWHDNVVYLPLRPATDYILTACYRAHRSSAMIDAFLTTATDVAGGLDQMVDHEKSSISKVMGIG